MVSVKMPAGNRQTAVHLKFVNDLIRMLHPSSRAVRVLTYCMLACLPFTVGGVNFFGALVIAASLLSREFWATIRSLARNPLVIISLFLLLLMALGVFHTTGPASEAFNVLNRYKKLLFIPLLIPHFQHPGHRIFAIKVLAWAIFTTVLLSWSEFFGWTHLSDPAYVEPPGDAVFKMHITQGVLFSLMVAITLGLALHAPSASSRLLYLGMAGITTADIGWVMIARTGKAVIPVLGIWAMFEFLRQTRLKRNHLILGLGLIVLTIGAVTTTFMLNPHTRMGSILQEVRETRQTGSLTSQGERVEFWKKGWTLFSSRPLSGYGTGSILNETARLGRSETTEVGRLATYNLHDEFLMWAAQLGVLGLAGILALFYFWLKSAFVNDEWSGTQTRGHWIVFVTGCLFNSFLSDFTEGFSMVLMIGLFTPLGMHFFSKTGADRHPVYGDIPPT